MGLVDYLEKHQWAWLMDMKFLHSGESRFESAQWGKILPTYMLFTKTKGIKFFK